MNIITFDTSLDKMYLTIGEDSRVDNYKIVENTKEQYHSALLIPSIIELLNGKNLTMNDIDAIGVNIGPGSFTGIRASATVARVIGQSLDIPIVGIPSLEEISLINTSEKNSLCILDARKNKAYVGIYSVNGDIIQPPVAWDYEEVIKTAKNNDYFIIADNRMTGIVKENHLECVNLLEINYNFGLNLAKLTYKHLKQDNPESFKWYNLKPLYIQPPPISTPKKK